MFYVIFSVKEIKFFQIFSNTREKSIEIISKIHFSFILFLSTEFSMKNIKILHKNEINHQKNQFNSESIS
jgi:hypothetical protein